MALAGATGRGRVPNWHGKVRGVARKTGRGMFPPFPSPRTPTGVRRCPSVATHPAPQWPPRPQRPRSAGCWLSTRRRWRRRDSRGWAARSTNRSSPASCGALSGSPSCSRPCGSAPRTGSRSPGRSSRRGSGFRSSSPSSSSRRGSDGPSSVPSTTCSSRSSGTRTPVRASCSGRSWIMGPRSTGAPAAS